MSASAYLPRSPLQHGPWRPLAVALIVSLAAGCGGGGNGGGGLGVDTGGTGATISFAAGSITGFGSIVVNGIRFDDATAQVVDNEGMSHDRRALKLGMQTEVQAGRVMTDAATGVATSQATRIEFGSQIKGAVQSVDRLGSTFVAVGQTVRVDAATVFDGVAGLSGLQAGAPVEIHAFYDNATATYTATRIEAKSSLADFRLVGPITALNTTSRMFVIGGASVGYAGVPAGGLPALANGLAVGVRLQQTQQGTIWIATSVTSDAPAVPDGAETEVEGFITDFIGLRSFKVNGIAVDAGAPGVVVRNGTATQLGNGVRVEVEGVSQASVLIASRVDVKTRGNADREFELRGAISSANAAARSFVLRDTTVTWGSGTRFDDGTLANLVAGASVEVKGVLSTTATGSQVTATRIKFER